MTHVVCYRFGATTDLASAMRARDYQGTHKKFIQDNAL